MDDYLNGRSSDWYAAFIGPASDRIADLVERCPDAAVDTCGDWTMSRLALHLGAVQRWATHIATHGAPPEDSSVLRAPDGADIAAWLRAGGAQAASVLEHLDPSAPMWNPWPVPQLAGVWPRRMAQETALHRVDAQLATGDAVPIDAELASDGVDEYLRWAVPRFEADGVVLPTGSLHLHCTDVMGEWLIDNHAASDGDATADDATGQGGYRVTREHAKGDAALRGRANDLLLALWGRPTPTGAIEVIGNAAVADGWLALGGR